MAITFNTSTIEPKYIYSASSGGTVFSSNYYNTSAFDYFTDSAVVNDCIYFGQYRRGCFQNVNFNIGTAIVADNITIVWEFSTSSGWKEFDKGYDDETNGFTETGLKSFLFGYPQNWHSRVYVNGVYSSWVRARITSVTNITEGGANTTDNVTFNTGDCDINDYSDASPCSLLTIYNYLSTNYSYLDIFKDDASYHYDLSAVNLRTYSRLKSTNESLLLGFNSADTAYSTDLNLGYLQLGDKIDENSGKNGSILLLRGGTNSYPVSFGSETKIYGSTVKSLYGIGYPTWIGEWLDSVVDSVNFSGGGSASVINCRVIMAGVYIAASFPSNFVNNTVIVDGTNFAYFYNSNVTISGASFYFDSGTHYIIYMYQTCTKPTYTFLNPDPLLPGVSTTNKIIKRNAHNPTKLFAKVWYYDTSEDTYTDYTTEFGNATEDDAPIDGDVGDIYYFGQTGSWWNFVLGITTNLASNDYEYEFEFYATGVWRPLTLWDRTNNFTTTDYMYLGKEYANSGTTSTINGYAAKWMRMKIVSKGTGNPAISRLLYLGQTGASEWNAYEKFTLDINVTNEEGIAIIGADVLIKLDGEEIYSGVTDANGDMVGQDLTNRHWYFDPINSFDNHQQIAEDTMNSYNIKITYAGKRTYKDSITMNSQKALEVSLSDGDTVMYDSQIKSNSTIY